jgi:PPE-repeat protein
MPTLGELAANHATHAVLLATNFFGINTIPIALNEADYARMWVQAATTMSTYQGVSSAAVTASPRTTAAPPIVSGDGTAAPAAPYDPITALFDFLSAVEKVFNSVGGEAGGDLFSYIFSVPPGTDPVSWFVGKISTLSSSTGGYPALLQGLVSAAGDNPALLALAYLFGAAAIGYDLTIQAIQFLVTFPLLAAGLAPLAAVPAALAGLGAGGVVGIAELHAHLPTGEESIPDTPAIPAVSPAPTTVSGPAAPASAPAAPAPAPAPAAPAPAPAFGAPSPPGAPPPQGSPAGPFPYLVGGVTKMGSQTSARVSARRKAAEPDIAAAPAAAAAEAREKRRRRRQRQGKGEMRGRGYEYMDLDASTGQDPGAAPSSRDRAEPTTASDRGAGALGFAGTTRQEAIAEAAGLATLAGDEFGGGPREPMMPSTWAPDESDEPAKTPRNS